MAIHKDKKLVFLYVLLSLSVFILVFEIVLRILFALQISNFYVEYKDLLEPTSHSLLGYQLKPLSQHKFYSINQNGLRGEPIESPKPPGQARIIVLGDSIIFGLGLALEDTYAVSLETLLKNKYNWPDVKVINMGVPGYNTQQEEAFLKMKGFDLQPDLVILGFCSNDSDPANIIDKNGILLAENPIRNVSDMNVRAVLNQSRFFVYMKYLFKRTIYNHPMLAQRFKANVFLNSRVYEKNWSKMKETLKHIAEQCQRHHKKFLVVLFPNQIQLYGKEEDNKIQQDMTSFLQAHNIDYVDLLPAFIAHRQEPLFLDASVHPNIKGTMVAAEISAEKISTGAL